MNVTLLGATGLIGGHLLNHLIADNEVTKITIIVRKPFIIEEPKVKAIVINFENEKAFRNAIEYDSCIFCAIGTTQKKVNGNKSDYRKVDYDIPVNAAKFGKEKGCKTFVLVSSIGANSKSKNFYTKLKGQVEDELIRLDYSKLLIFRPSLLLGNRKEKRFGERMAQIIFPIFSFLTPCQYKPIKAEFVAKAMFESTRIYSNGVHILNYKNIIKLNSQ